MNSTTITFPVFILSTDKEVACYHNSYSFFEMSGCEEFNFADDVTLIFDSQGMLLHYSPNTRTLEINGSAISSEKAEAYFSNHFSEWAPKRQSEFLSRTHGMSVDSVINLGRSML